jgi:hypothetical protein
MKRQGKKVPSVRSQRTLLSSVPTRCTMCQANTMMHCWSIVVQSHGVTRAPKERGWLMKLFLGSDKPMDVMAQKFGIGPVSSGSHICRCLANTADV